MPPTEPTELTELTPPRARLVLATNNAGKVAELRRLLAPSVVIVTMAELGIETRPDKGDTSIEEMARIKAEAVAERTGAAALGEQSGLQVEALGGFPGAISREWLGRGATDVQRMRGLLDMTAATGDVEGRARMVTALALARPGAETVVVTGVCEGRLVDPPRHGLNGFGYDPAFEPNGSPHTLAEASLPERDAISSRSRAVKALKRTPAFKSLGE